MDHSKNINLIRIYVIDNSVGTFDHFSNWVNIVFRNSATCKRELAYLLGSSSEPSNHALGIFRGILGNMGVDCIKMGLGCISPMDLHSVKPYFARTSFTSLVRSSLLSAKPRSITSRTYISFMRSSIPCGIWRHPVDQLVGFVLLKDHRHEISSFIVQTVTPNQGDFKSS